MSGAPLVRLGDCCEIVSGATPKTAVAEYWAGDIAWATPKDLSALESKYIDTTPQMLTEAGYRSCSAKIMPAGSVLFSSRAPIGHVAINSVPMCTNQGFKSFVPDPERVSPDYLYHWLRANKAHLQSLGNGATFKEVSKATVSEVRVPLPALAEQRRIAAILDKADALRAKRREAIAKLDQLLQSVFLDMFGDPERNPRGLNSEPLQAVCGEIYRYPTYYGIKYESQGVPEVRGEMITSDGQIDSQQARYISLATSQRFPRTQLSPGDLVMSVRGTVGKIGLVPDRLSGANITANLIRVSPNPEKVHPIFLWRFAMSEYFARYVNQASSSTTIKTIKAPDLKAMPVILPRMAEQLKFVSAYRAYRSMDDSIYQSTQRLDKLFASLQNRAFSGAL